MKNTNGTKLPESFAHFLQVPLEKQRRNRDVNVHLKYNERTALNPDAQVLPMSTMATVCNLECYTKSVMPPKVNN